MKIGIMTFCTPREHNYGQILQFYALQRYLGNHGHDAFFIKYDRTLDRVSKRPFWLRAVRALNPYIFVKHFYLKHKKFMAAKEDAANPRYFENFLAKYTKESSVKYASLDDLRKNSPEADVYIAGSDQVWNAEFLGHESQIRAFFLDFGSSDIHRIAYAASWGRDTFPREYIERVSLLLKKFHAVSVREKSGVDLCGQAGYKCAKWVCDPTLLLNAEEYRRIYSENLVRKREGKYIFLYFLGNKTDFDVKTVYDFAKRKGLEVVYVTGNAQVDRYEKFFATIPEWLYLIDNAEYVVTNSFHGAVFSTLFGKRYGVIPCTGKAALMNTRIDSLFECCNIQPRWLEKGEGFAVLDKPYNADFSAFRQESIRFLEEALSNVQEGEKALKNSGTDLD